MTVKELIEHLQQFPPEVTIIYSCCSEYEEMDAENVNIVKKEDARIVLRDGRYSIYVPTHWPVGEHPVFPTVVLFPGN